MGAETPGCSQSSKHSQISLALLFSLLLCRRNSGSQSGSAIILWGKLQYSPLHPRALWVSKPVFQALHFFSEDTPVPPDAEWEGGT